MKFHSLIRSAFMRQTKLAITIEEGALGRLNALVRRKVFSSRGRAIQEAMREKQERLEPNRLAEACAKLDPSFENPGRGAVIVIAIRGAS